MHANKALQDTIIYLAACYACCDTLVDTNQDKLRPAMKELKTARTLLMKVLEEAERDVEAEQMDHLKRQTADIRLDVVHKANPRADRREVVVREDDLRELADMALTGCWLCGKTGADAKRCSVRRLLLRCGVTGDMRAECPYKEGEII